MFPDVSRLKYFSYIEGSFSSGYCKSLSLKPSGHLPDGASRNKTDIVSVANIARLVEKINNLALLDTASKGSIYTDIEKQQTGHFRQRRWLQNAVQESVIDPFAALTGFYV
jgi:hypothetical protein